MINCVFENGNKASLRHVTIGSIAINDKSQILLVKRAPYLLNGNKYAIPGGFLDRNEDTKEGALRELLEETGLEGEVQSLFRINDNPNRKKEDRQNVDFIYITRIIGGKLKLSSESTEARWFTKENLPPEEEFAFDHREAILLYFQYLKSPFLLPIIG